MKMLKKGPKKKSEMSDMEQKAIMKVLSDMSDEAGDAMGGKLVLKASSKDEAEMLLDKAEDAVEAMPEKGEGKGEPPRKEYMEDDFDMDKEMEGEEYDESEEDYFEKGMDDYESEPDMGEELEDKVEDFSNIDPEELDAKIEQLMAIREKMKTATV